jgi:hypothetical protein
MLSAHQELMDAALALQYVTKKNGDRVKEEVPAKSTTREEFEDIMRELVSTAKIGLMRWGLKPLFSWDNNKIQKTANLERMGLTAAERVSLPVYSPDMHKVIEHYFGIIKPMVRKHVLGLGKATIDVVDGMAIVKSCWQLTKLRYMGSIKKDVESLPVTWHIISTEEGVSAEGPDGKLYVGTGGEWAPKPWR